MECHGNPCFLRLRIASFQTLLSTGVLSERNFSPGSKTLTKYRCSSRNQEARDQNTEALCRITKALSDLLIS